MLKYLLISSICLVLFLLYLCNSILVLRSPIIVLFNSDEKDSNVSVFGPIANKFINKFNDKNYISKDCYVLFTVVPFSISLDRAHCFLSIFQYIFLKNNHRLQWVDSVKMSNSIVIFGRRFNYSIKNNIMSFTDVPYKKYKHVANDSKLYFCIKMDLEKFNAFSDNEYANFAYNIKEYLTQIKFICVFVIKDDVNVIIITDNQTSKLLFSDIIKIYEKFPGINMREVNKQQYYINITNDIGKLVIIEYYGNFVLIRFSNNLQNPIKSYNIKKLSKNISYYNGCLYLNNIKLKTLLEYINTFFKIKITALNKLKINIIINGVLLW